MKNVFFMGCILLATALMAQEGPRLSKGHPKHKMEMMKDLTPEQQADLKTKRMTLDLNLTEAQQKEVMAINLDAAKNRPERPSKDKKLSADEQYKRASERLEHGIETKAKLRDVLSEEQFAKFEKSQKQKRRHRRYHSRKDRL